MGSNKFCPGAQVIREPIPENIACPNCKAEVEIWTNEFQVECPNCGSNVFRAQQASCIDWCPHARECVGPAVYEKMRPSVPEASPNGDSPLGVLKAEHDRALKTLQLLREAGWCLKRHVLTSDLATRERGIGHLTKVIDFFEKDMRSHFRREEDVLFPALEKHIGVDKSPTRLLLEEHVDVWRHFGQFKEQLAGLAHGEQTEALSAAVEDFRRYMDGMLPQHIKRENEGLLPLAITVLTPNELAATCETIRALV